jgi:putative membrane protein
VVPCVFLFLAGGVLAVSDRLALGRPRGSGLSGAASQSLAPLNSIVALLVQA